MTQPTTAEAGKPRVLVVSRAIPIPGGSYRSWSLLQLRSLQEAGYATRVLNVIPWVPKPLGLFGKRLKDWSRSPAQHDCDGVNVRYLRAPWYPRPDHCNFPQRWSDLAWAAVGESMRQELADFAPDLIYTIGALPAGEFARRLGQESNTPFVVTVHSLNELRNWRQSRWLSRFMGRVFEQSATSIVVANSMLPDAEAIAPQANLKTVHNGFDFPTSLSAPVETHERPTILCCGSFTERKDIPLLIESFSAIAGKHPEAQLRIIGSGPTLPEVEATAKKLGLGDQLQLLGRRPHEEVLREIAACDFFALLSRNEPFATVYVEAMAFGKPVVCCSDGGIADVVADGIHGRVTPPGDKASAAEALDNMLNDREATREMGQRARELYESYLTAQSWVTRMDGVFNQVLGRETNDEAACTSQAKPS